MADQSNQPARRQALRERIAVHLYPEAYRLAHENGWHSSPEEIAVQKADDLIEELDRDP